MFKLHPAESKLFQLVCVGFYIPLSAAASGRAGWALAHPEFGSSVNPITTRGADYAHHITASPPGFENPTASLPGTCLFQWMEEPALKSYNSILIQKLF